MMHPARGLLIRPGEVSKLSKPITWRPVQLLGSLGDNATGDVRLVRVAAQ
jgi:hypothetical protein